MNILMINYEYPPLGGGGGVFNKQLAEELVEKNEITVVTSRFAGLKSFEVRNDVEIVRAPIIMRGDQNAATIISMLSFFPASLFMGNNLLKERRFDIIHSMFAIPSAPSGLILSKKFHIPHVLSILGGDVYDPSKKLSPHKTPLLRYTVARMMAGSDRVVALSNDIRNRALEFYDVSAQIDVIHLGIPQPSFRAKSRSDLGFRSDEILLTTVGRLVTRKGLKELIHIISELHNLRIRLIIIGDGPERRKLEELAQSLKLSESINFLGYITDEEKFQLLNISDIYVSSSHHEGFGIVFLEAMSSGLPIICYDKGGQTDFLMDQKTGFVVEYGNKKLFAKKIRELCQNPIIRSEMSHFNTNYVEKYYISNTARNYQKLYRSL